MTRSKKSALKAILESNCYRNINNEIFRDEEIDKNKLAEFYLEKLNTEIERNIQDIISMNELHLSKLDSLEEHICLCDSNDYQTDPGKEILPTSDLVLVDKDQIEDCRRIIQRSMDQLKAINYFISTIKVMSKLTKDNIETCKMNAHEIIDCSLNRVRNIYYTRTIHKEEPMVRYNSIIKCNELLSFAIDSILCNLIDNNEHDDVYINISITPTTDDRYWKFEFKDGGGCVPNLAKKDQSDFSIQHDRYLKDFNLSFAVASEIVKLNDGNVLLTADDEGHQNPGRNFQIFLPKG